MTLRAALAIVRPGNALMAASGVVVGMLLWGLEPSWSPVWFLAPLSALCITAFGNVLNDLTDIEVDRTAHPRRPLPSGQLSVASARRIALVAAMAGLLSAVLAGAALLALAAVIVLVILVLYERRWKSTGLAGNVAVAALTGATFLYGALAARIHETFPASWSIQANILVGADDQRFPGTMAAAAALMAFLLNLAREVVKDIEDMDGDRGRRMTIALRHGLPRARAVALGAVVLAVSVCSFLAMAGWLLNADSHGGSTLGRLAAVPLGLAALGALLGGLTVPLQPRRAQLAFKGAMLVAVIGLALLGTAVHDALRPGL